ncbi:zinc ABC transporter solute-binding protein, partial [Helicobacter pylori]|nr:zinc ABC transporter solute-binding protein [Helicobacter pylori]MWR36463.1 zinc ABC transporter solute-binding protein [Helicobacter pylori]
MRTVQFTLMLAAIGFGIASAQVKVAATTGFIADMVKNVGGSRVHTIQVVPGNSDPHSFEPKPSVV